MQVRMKGSKNSVAQRVELWRVPICRKKEFDFYPGGRGRQKKLQIPAFIFLGRKPTVEDNLEGSSLQNVKTYWELLPFMCR